MKTKEQLIKVFEEVIEDIISREYEYKDNYIEFPETDRLIYESKMYKSIQKGNNKPKFQTPLKIYVQNIDTFEKAKELGSECAVLNMASSKRPGGGVETGSRAQEEELCRRSNLLLSLYLYSPEKWDEYFGDYYSGKVLNDFSYPIPVYGGIYSPGVCVYRKPGTYETVSNYFKCNVISVAGVVRPDIDKNTGEMMKKYVPIVKGKIRTILRIALDNNHTKLVLGALGCGAFKNPPSHVARLFKEVLEEPEFIGAFEEICFAILDDGNSGRDHNPNGNLKPFADVFGEKI